MAAKTFVVTAGHSNADPGAVNPALGITESEIVMEMRNIVAHKLRERGYTVLTDGEGNVNKPLRDAIALVKKGDVAIEFHCNAAANFNARGVETISLPKDKKLAQAISAAISKVTNSPLRGDSGWIDQSQSHRGKLGFVSAGGLIVELFFISNEMDYKAFWNVRWLVATAVVDALTGE